MKKWIIALIVVTALVLPGCTAAGPNTPGSSAPKSSPQQNHANMNANAAHTNAVYDGIKVTPVKVFKTYTGKFPGTKVKELELDFERGSYIYEIEGYDDTKEYELKIDTMNGIIVEEKQKQQDNKSKTGEITLEDVHKIPELVNKTLKDAGDEFKVDEWALKTKRNQTVFEIEVVNEQNHDIDYTYNVKTGEIMKKKQ